MNGTQKKRERKKKRKKQPNLMECTNINAEICLRKSE